MSKKKVEIKRDALEPQTIKVIKKHNFSFLIVLFVIGIFGVLIYFLDDLFAIYENYTKTGVISISNVNSNTNMVNNTNVNINNTVDNTINEEPQKEITYLVLNTDNSVTFDDVTFNDISYQNNNISVNIISKTNSTLYLNKLSYFINIYNENKELLKTVFFYENINGRLSKTIEVNNAYYYNIVSLKDEDYPYFTLEPDENDKTYLTCDRNQTTITYTFADEKLSNIEDKITINDPDDNIKNQYESLKTTYEVNNGVTVSITNGNPYIFVVNVDLKLYNGNIKTYYFDRNAYAREIKYKLEAMNFTCR